MSANEDADELRRRVLAHVGIDPGSRSQVRCPRERSATTPCLVRNGRAALDYDEVCAGCGESPTALLAELKP